MNFEITSKKFTPGYYTSEIMGKKSILTYWLVYSDKKKNHKKINNSGLMLEKFDSLPERATINNHK